MHNLKRMFLAVGILLVFGAFAAYANGQGESSNVRGTVTKIQPTANGNSVNVTVSTKSGSYTVTVDQSVVNNASLQVGQSISLKGAIHRNADGSKDVNATELEVDGKQYSVPQQPATAGNGSDSSSQAPEAEKPDQHPNKNDSSPDVGKPEGNQSKDSQSNDG